MRSATLDRRLGLTKSTREQSGTQRKRRSVRAVPRNPVAPVMAMRFPANDSPETISAALELGIQHPPGYPLHTLLGRLAVIGLPWGSAAWRMNCLSASLGVAAALLAALACRDLLR